MFSLVAVHEVQPVAHHYGDKTKFEMGLTTSYVELFVNVAYLVH